MQRDLLICTRHALSGAHDNETVHNRRGEAQRVPVTYEIEGTRKRQRATRGQARHHKRRSPRGAREAAVSSKAGSPRAPGRLARHKDRRLLMMRHV